jgi:hypothetical protein
VWIALALCGALSEATDRTYGTYMTYGSQPKRQDTSFKPQHEGTGLFPVGAGAYEGSQA